MLNCIAFVLCTFGAIAQWNKDWLLFTVGVIFAVFNLFFAANWIYYKTKTRKRNN